MATCMLPIKPIGLKTSITTTTKGKIPSSPKWWGPVFGWSTEADYIDSEENKNKSNNDNKINIIASDSNIIMVKSRFSPGTFTEEKARQLRMMTTKTTAFHDAMYHSSIATKLASDFCNG